MVSRKNCQQIRARQTRDILIELLFEIFPINTTFSSSVRAVKPNAIVYEKNVSLRSRIAVAHHPQPPGPQPPSPKARPSPTKAGSTNNGSPATRHLRPDLSLFADAKRQWQRRHCRASPTIPWPSPTACSSVTLDFGGGVFTGSEPTGWKSTCETNGASGVHHAWPRANPSTPVPYAIMANSASNLLGNLPAAQLSGTLANCPPAQILRERSPPALFPAAARI
jgi:hypothetical protein